MCYTVIDVSVAALGQAQKEQAMETEEFDEDVNTQEVESVVTNDQMFFQDDGDDIKLVAPTKEPSFEDELLPIQRFLLVSLDCGTLL